MKIKLGLTAIVAFAFNAFLFALPADNIKSENSLYTEVYSAYKSEFFPGAIRYADDFEKNFAQSSLLPNVLLYKGESLYKLGRLSEAKVTLQNTLKICTPNSDVNSKAAYWLAKSYFDSEEYSQANDYFYDSLSLLKNNDSLQDFYDSTVYFAAKTCLALEDYSNSVLLLEYIIANGSNYESAQYCDAAISLFLAYSKTNQNQKISNLFEQFSSLPLNVVDKLAIYAGDAENNLGNYKRAYELFESVLSHGNSELAVVALQKAYSVSVAHPKEVQKNPGDVLASVQSKLSSADFDSIIDEFWLRLGLDSYKSKDFAKTQEYFSYISPSATNSVLQMRSLYLAEVFVQTGKLSVEENAKKAQTELLSAMTETKLSSDSENVLYDEYFKNLTRYAALQKNWKESLTFAGNVKTLDADFLYWKSLSLYKSESFAESLLCLQTECENSVAWKKSTESQKLYARLLAKTGNISESQVVFAQLYKNNLLTGDAEKEDYAVVLISGANNSNGNYKQVLDVLQNCKSISSIYLCALANFNLGNWTAASQLFAEYVSKEKNQSKQTEYAAFYSGYAQYLAANFAGAAKTLSQFVKQYPESSFVWNAAITASSSYVQSSNLVEAQNFAEKALNLAVSQSNRQESVILCAAVYLDSNKFDNAISLLKPYSLGRDNFALQCRFQLAQIYEKAGSIQLADQTYASISKDFANNNLAEESDYRRGELYLSAKNYSVAQGFFDNYIKKYPSGKFYDAALYHGSECLLNQGLTDKAILQYALFLQVVSESPYRYAAMKNLCVLYRQNGEYEQALALAQNMLNVYGTQAVDDKINIQIDELKLLASGFDSEVVAKKTEYENKGKNSTPSGRKAGTELASMYAKNIEMKSEGLLLAQQLLDIQVKNIESEHDDAATNALLLAQDARQNAQNSKSANLYLSAAEYLRMSATPSQEKVAQALYGAVEAFDAAQMYADSKESAALLEKLYPNSRQSVAAQQIVNRN